jgi:DNA-nicking Smr family endonuclease
MGKGKASPPPLPFAATPEDEERRLFERELAGVRPLRPGPTRVTPTPATLSEAPGRRAAPREPPATLAVERQGNRITGAAFGVSHATLRELAQGRFPVEATSDLHGLRAEPARLRLRAFLAACAARGRRAVLVVCGRGLHSGPDGPVLLEVAREVLTRPPACDQVQAFSSAAAGQGGEGALVVLLRHAEPPSRR